MLRMKVRIHAHSTDVAICKASVKEALTKVELAHREATIYLVL